MDPPGVSLLATALTLVGCSSTQLVDVPTHSQLHDGELMGVAPPGEVRVGAETPDRAEHALVWAYGIVIERDGSILRTHGGEFVESAPGTLLATDRRGRRYATLEP